MSPTAAASIDCIRAANPGQMTLSGTNSYRLRGTGATIIIDPGPDLDAHLDALASTPVDLILVTHRHHDHTDGVDGLHDRTGAPVRAALPAWCRDAAPLRDGERIEIGDVRLEVVAAPGHTSDSLVFVDAASEAVFTGDTLLGGSSTVIDHPDGTLADYLASLDRLATVAATAAFRMHPGHGDHGADLAGEIDRAQRHRRTRLAQVRAVVDRLGEDADPQSVLEVVYADAPERVRRAALASLAAQLAYVREERGA